MSISMSESYFLFLNTIFDFLLPKIIWVELDFNVTKVK